MSDSAAVSNFHIRNLTRRAIPGVAFGVIKNYVLGTEYELSLTFAGDRRIRRWNRVYRQKDKTTNILSFPLSKTEGEIFINLRLVKDTWTALMLFIHGLHHLKGMEHGTLMERNEDAVRTHFELKYKIFEHGTKTSNRNRRRDLRSTRGRVRVRER